LPRLRRWAKGRIPPRARGVLETDDLVQEVLVRTVGRLDTFETRSRGEFHSYLRRALSNRIRDEIRRAAVRPDTGAFVETADDEVSPLDAAIGRDEVARYEAALARLRPEDREAVIAKLELRCTYGELADVLGKPSADAARMTVSRALVRLAREIADAEKEPRRS
jgi:RNA polymerase sigma-70 factor (ECF subfamily)